MRLHELTAADALESLGSGPAGLSEREVARRRAEFGPNEIERLRREPLLLRLASQFTHFFAIILWCAAAMALLAEWRDPGSGMGRLAVAIVCVIVINGIFSFAQESRAEHAIASLQLLLPNNVRVVRDGAVTQAPAPELVPGDVVVLEAGDRVPADCRIVESVGARVNSSAITGEAVPEERDAAPCVGAASPAHTRNVLLAGSFVVSGRARGVVFASGMRTEIGQIARLAQTATPGLSPLQQEIRRLGRIVALFATALGGAFFVLGELVGLPLWTNLLFGIGVIVANVPEGLLPTVTLALAMGSQRMARRNALVRRLPAVETLGCATVICTDKTGTLTENRMAPARLYAGSQFHPVDEATLRSLPRDLFRCALHCHDLIETRDGWQGDPMELALLKMARSALGPEPQLERIGEIPFDTEKRRLTTLHRGGGKTWSYTKGAPETVLPLCNAGEQRRAALLQAAARMAQDGLRVLAFAFREVRAGEPPDRHLTFAGMAGLLDPPRPEVPDAIRRCREAGIRVVMITGDHPLTAAAVARAIGLPVGQVLDGPRVHRMTDEQLQLALDLPGVQFARMDPADKRRVIEAFKRKKDIVAVTGDGVNDAPALRAADIGIAMGIAGTDVAREAADVVLVDDNFATIVNAVEEGRAIFSNIRKFLAYVLTSNVPELVPYLAMVLFRVPLAITIMQILAIDLGTDLLPALALGAEPPTADVMQRPPRRRSDGLVDGGLILRAYGFLGVFEAAAAMFAFFAIAGAGPRAADDPLYLRATSACLAAVVVMQVANLFLCRSERDSLFARGLFDNRLLLFGIACELSLIALIVYTPPGHAVFGTAPLSARDWLLALPFAAAMIAAEEARKALSRKRDGRLPQLRDLVRQ